MIVSIAVFALVLGVVAAPVRATNGDDDHSDLEWARDYAIGVVNHKIDLLRECREDAKTDHAWAIYSEAIEELGDIKDLIREEDDVDGVWELKYRAKDLYAETKELAKAADEAGEHDDSDDEDDDDESEKKEEEEKKRKDEEAKKKREQEEKKRKDEEAKNKREQEEKKRKEAEERRRVEEMESAKAETLQLIDKKIRLMTAASLSSHHRQMSDIYREAADALIALRPAAAGASSVEELDGIRDQVWEIVHAAKKKIAAFRPGHHKDDDGNSDETGDRTSNDGGDGTNGEDDDGNSNDGGDGTNGEDDDGNSNDGGDGTGGDAGDDPQDDSVEEQAIVTALNAMELEVDMYQISIQLALVPEIGFGFPEGPDALAAGSALLDAIDAARLLTGDDLVLAYADVNDRYNEYLHLVWIFDLEWEVGILNGEISPI